MNCEKVRDGFSWKSEKEKLKVSLYVGAYNYEPH